MSEPAWEGPAEADAVAGNIDHPDLDYDVEGIPWEPDAADTPDPEELVQLFNEAARQHGMEHAQEIVEHLIGTHIAPLGAEMESMLEQERYAEGWDAADGIFEEAGLDEGARDEAFEAAEAFVDWHAREMGVDPAQWLGLLAASRGTDEAGAARLVFQAVGDVMQHHAHLANAKDELAVVDKYFSGVQPATPAPRDEIPKDRDVRVGDYMPGGQRFEAFYGRRG